MRHRPLQETAEALERVVSRQPVERLGIAPVITADEHLAEDLRAVRANVELSQELALVVLLVMGLVLGVVGALNSCFERGPEGRPEVLS
jgi:hypothetical protein